MVSQHNEHSIAAHVLPPSPEGCFWEVEYHANEPYVTVALCSNFLSLGSTILKQDSVTIDAAAYDCPRSLQDAKERAAVGIAERLLTMV